MLYILLIVFLVIVTGIGVYLAMLEGKYEVRRTKVIETDIDTVFDKIRDLKSWADWSPWLIHEPDARLEFSDSYTEEGGFYIWDGERVGAGKLTHVKFDRPRRIEQSIEFIRPFKSVCQVAFELTEKDARTEVAWTLRGKMPFLFRFMTQKTTEMIGKDYDLGLAMLAGRLNPDTEHPVLDFQGEIVLDPMPSLCKGFSGGLPELKTAMETGFTELISYIEHSKGKIAGAPLAAYYKVNLKTMHFVCDMAVPVSEAIDAGEFQLKTLDGGHYYKVVLKGSYEFLELAWYAAMSHVRMLKLKVDARRPSLEVYENDPRQVQTSNAIETTIYVPIKPA